LSRVSAEEAVFAWKRRRKQAAGFSGNQVPKIGCLNGAGNWGMRRRHNPLEKKGLGKPQGRFRTRTRTDVLLLMNDIAKSQNEPRQLQRLAAQRQLYSTAKRIFGIQLLLGGPIAIGWSLVVVASPELRGFAAVWGALVSFSDVVWLTPWQKRLRERAAKIRKRLTVMCFSSHGTTSRPVSLQTPNLLKSKPTSIRMPSQACRL
jgi:hypothetical protein